MDSRPYTPTNVSQLYPGPVETSHSLDQIIATKEAEKAELVKRKGALATEMGAVTAKIHEIEQEITSLHFRKGQVGAGVVGIALANGTGVGTPRSAGPHTATPTRAAPIPPSEARAPAAPSSAGESGKLKKKKTQDSDSSEVEIVGESNTTKTKKQKSSSSSQAVDPAPEAADDEPFEVGKRKSQIVLAKAPSRDMTTSIFNRVPRAFLKSPTANMVIASGLDGDIYVLKPQVKKMWVF
jgi:hypothetical protein